MIENVLQINNLKFYQDKRDFLDIPFFNVRKGSSVVILGGNGAGKTTLLETIVGLNKPSSGNVLWSESKSSWGVQLQSSTYNKDYKVCEIIRLHGNLYHRTCPKIFVDFAISALMNKSISALSRGEKQRVDLYLAMAHLPSIVVLDEPGTGLDKSYYDAMVQHIRKLQADKGCTIIMASHSAFELSLATDIVWMENGIIKNHLPKKEFIQKYLGQRKVVMKFHCTENIDNALEAMSKAPPLLSIEHSPHEISFYGGASMAKAALEYSLKNELASFLVSDIEDNDIFDFVCFSRDKFVLEAL